jgi:membrane protease YdiL (CAAX protease family)
MLSEKPWALDSVMRLFLGIIITYCVGTIPINLLDHVTRWPAAERDFLEMLAAVLFLQVSALVWIGYFLRRHALGWKQAFGLESDETPTVVAYGILAGALFLPCAVGVQTLCAKLLELANFKPEAQAAVQALEDPTIPVIQKFVFGAVAVVLVPLVEESLFRGILYPAIKQLGYPRLALWGTSILFGALHANGPSFLPLVLFALLLVWLYETFGNLLAPIVAHGFFNAANFVVLMFQDRIDHLFNLQ